MPRQALLLFTFMALTAQPAQSGGGKDGRDKLPGAPNVPCDARLLETNGMFKIAKTGSIIPKDSKRVLIFWVLEAQSDMTDFQAFRESWGIRPSESHFRGPRILFKDVDRVMIDESTLVLQGLHAGMKKGDGLRAFIEVPRDLIQDTRSAAIVQ